MSTPMEDVNPRESVRTNRERVAIIVEQLKYPEGHHPYLACACAVCVIALSIRQGKAG